MTMAVHLNQSTAPKAAAAKSLTAEKLLVAAGELMIERNSVEISLADIAHKSGVNAALVKYHFGNKDGLLLALLERDASNEMTHLEFLLAQPLSPTTKMKLHIAGIIKAYHQFPYLNRLIHYLLHGQNSDTADEVTKFFVGPLLDFHRRLLAEGVASGHFYEVDPVLFYTTLIGACDHLFFGRQTMMRAAGVGPVTDEVCRAYVAHIERIVLGGLLTAKARRPSVAGS